MNYVTKKGRLQNWTQLHKEHKKLDNEMQLKGFEMRKETRSYLLSIKSVQGLPHSETGSASATAPMAGARYYLEYYMTLFNKDIGAHGGFYGRTYRSKAYPVKESAGSWDLNQEEFVYLHTSFVDKNSLLVVECVLVREIAGMKTYSSAGYALCEIFQFKGQDVVELNKGTPRSIGLLGLDATASRGVKSGGRLTFELRDFPQYDKVKSLVP